MLHKTFGGVSLARSVLDISNNVNHVWDICRNETHPDSMRMSV